MQTDRHPERWEFEEPTIVGDAYCPRCDDDHEYGYVHSEDEPNLTVPDAAAATPATTSPTSSSRPASS